VHFQRKRKAATLLGVAEDPTVLAGTIFSGHSPAGADRRHARDTPCHAAATSHLSPAVSRIFALSCTTQCWDHETARDHP
jgi:hypothetical protein